MKHRLSKTLLLCLALVAAFCALFALYSITGLGIPCILRTATGLECPACGTFRMLSALMRLDFAAAIAFNPVMLFLLPALAALFLSYTIRYVKSGTKDFGKAQAVLAAIIIAVLIAFGALRNFL